MANLSGNFLRTIEEFAVRMGMHAQPGRDGSVSFEYEQSGTLSFTPSLDSWRLIVSLTKPIPHQNDRHERNALLNAGPDVATGLQLHAGIAGDGRIVLAFSLEEGEAEISLIERCVTRLIEVQQRLG